MTLFRFCFLFAGAAVPDVERVVERLQHGLQHDRDAGAGLQEDQYLPDDALRRHTSARLREGLRGSESHLVPVHAPALRLRGLRTLHALVRVPPRRPRA